MCSATTKIICNYYCIILNCCKCTSYYFTEHLSWYIWLWHRPAAVYERVYLKEIRVRSSLLYWMKSFPREKHLFNTWLSNKKLGFVEIATCMPAANESRYDIFMQAAISATWTQLSGWYEHVIEPPQPYHLEIITQ